MAARWSTPDDLMARLRRRWEAGELLRTYTEKQWEPITVPIRAPGATEIAADLGAAQHWLAGWKSLDPNLISLEWRRVGGRLVGSNEVPCRATIETPDRLWALLRVRRQVQTFEELLADTRQRAPSLVDWMTAEPTKVLAHERQWHRLVDVVLWLGDTPTQRLYLRQIDVAGVDTKFVEQHRAILSQLLDRHLPADRVDPAHPPHRFTQRYRFRPKPTYVRLRAPGLFGPFTELTVRVDELADRPLDVDRLVVVENETTFLALPTSPGTAAVFGGGYAVPALAPLSWLHDRTLVYWGDIDTHGLAILDRLRAVFPHTTSILMDEATVLRHEAHWGREDTPVTADLPHLTTAEAQLYHDLVTDRFAPRLRLEQERIRFGDVVHALTR